MGGGAVIGQAIAQDLVDELHLHVAPIILGSGIPLFHRSPQKGYRLTDLHKTSSAVHHIYERSPAEPLGNTPARFPITSERSGNPSNRCCPIAHRTTAGRHAGESRSSTVEH